MRVLVVDDSSPVRERLVQMIAELDGVSSVEEAWDVPSALKQLSTFQPGLLVLDLRIPGGGGVHILRELSQEEIDRPVVVVLTNYPYPQLRAKCIELGSDYFLDKSTDFEQIAGIVASIRERSNGTATNIHGKR